MSTMTKWPTHKTTYPSGAFCPTKHNWIGELMNIQNTDYAPPINDDNYIVEYIDFDEYIELIEAD